MKGFLYSLIEKKVKIKIASMSGSAIDVEVGVLTNIVTSGGYFYLVLDKKRIFSMQYLISIELLED